METIIETKICKRCNKELTLDKFYKHPGYKDGLCNKCKICVGEVQYENVLEKQKQVESNIWTCSSCNRELVLDSENFHKRSDSVTGYQHRCKVCLKKDPRRVTRLIKNNDLDLFIYDNFYNAQYRAKKKNIEFTITSQDLKELWDSQKGKCALTGLNMTHIKLEGKVKTNLSIDRINPNLGYIKDNVQLVCNIVNVMKSDMNMDDLKYYCNLILQGHD